MMKLRSRLSPRSSPRSSPNVRGSTVTPRVFISHRRPGEAGKEDCGQVGGTNLDDYVSEAYDSDLFLLIVDDDALKPHGVKEAKDFFTEIAWKKFVLFPFFATVVVFVIIYEAYRQYQVDR